MVLNFAKPHLNLEGQILADREVRPARYGPTVGVLLFWWVLEISRAFDMRTVHCTLAGAFHSQSERRRS